MGQMSANRINEHGKIIDAFDYLVERHAHLEDMDDVLIYMACTEEATFWAELMVEKYGYAG